MKSLPQDSVLILIDVQQAFNHPSWGQRNNLNAESQIAALLAHWRATQRPIIHVHHRNPRPGSLFNPDSVGCQVKPEALPLPNEPVLYKDVNSSFIGTDLESRLRIMGASHLVIVGITTDHCVSTTVRMAGNFGFTTFVISDATATFERHGVDDQYFSAEQMHDTALASLNGEFARVLRTEEVLAMTC
jgi:nicotinamidase-related amidase